MCAAVINFTYAKERVMDIMEFHKDGFQMVNAIVIIVGTNIKTNNRK